MNSVAARLVGKAREAAYFAEQSKFAVGRIKEKVGDSVSASAVSAEVQADVLPEILSHSLPLQATIQRDSSMVSTASLASSPSVGKKVFTSDHNPDVVNPLNAMLVLPKPTFGPKRWKVSSEEVSVHASTANEMRQDHDVPIVDDEDPNDVLQGYTMIGKAFAIATGIVFGGAAVIGAVIASKFDLHSKDDIKREGRDFFAEKVKRIQDNFESLKTWVGEPSKK